MLLLKPQLFSTRGQLLITLLVICKGITSPVLDPDVHTSYAVRGSDVVLVCDIATSQNITWSVPRGNSVAITDKNVTADSGHHDVMERYHRDAQTLTISHLGPEDVGVYACADARRDEAVFKQLLVMIDVPPRPEQCHIFSAADDGDTFQEILCTGDVVTTPDILFTLVARGNGNASVFQVAQGSYPHFRLDGLRRDVMTRVRKEGGENRPGMWLLVCATSTHLSSASSCGEPVFWDLDDNADSDPDDGLPVWVVAVVAVVVVAVAVFATVLVFLVWYRRHQREIKAGGRPENPRQDSDDISTSPLSSAPCQRSTGWHNYEAVANRQDHQYVSSHRLNPSTPLDQNGSVSSALAMRTEPTTSRGWSHGASMPESNLRESGLTDDEKRLSLSTSRKNENHMTPKSPFFAEKTINDTSPPGTCIRSGKYGTLQECERQEIRKLPTEATETLQWLPGNDCDRTDSFSQRFSGRLSAKLEQSPTLVYQCASTQRSNSISPGMGSGLKVKAKQTVLALPEDTSDLGSEKLRPARKTSGPRSLVPRTVVPEHSTNCKESRSHTTISLLPSTTSMTVSDKSDYKLLPARKTHTSSTLTQLKQNHKENEVTSLVHYISDDGNEVKGETSPEGDHRPMLTDFAKSGAKTPSKRDEIRLKAEVGPDGYDRLTLPSKNTSHASSQPHGYENVFYKENMKDKPGLVVAEAQSNDKKRGTSETRQEGRHGINMPNKQELGDDSDDCDSGPDLLTHPNTTTKTNQYIPHYQKGKQRRKTFTVYNDSDKMASTENLDTHVPSPSETRVQGHYRRGRAHFPNFSSNPRNLNHAPATCDVRPRSLPAHQRTKAGRTHSGPGANHKWEDSYEDTWLQVPPDISVVLPDLDLPPKLQKKTTSGDAFLSATNRHHRAPSQEQIYAVPRSRPLTRRTSSEGSLVKKQRGSLVWPRDESDSGGVTGEDISNAEQGDKNRSKPVRGFYLPLTESPQASHQSSEPVPVAWQTPQPMGTRFHSLRAMSSRRANSDLSHNPLRRSRSVGLARERQRKTAKSSGQLSRYWRHGELMQNASLVTEGPHKTVRQRANSFI